MTNIYNYIGYTIGIIGIFLFIFLIISIRNGNTKPNLYRWRLYTVSLIMVIASIISLNINHTTTHLLNSDVYPLYNSLTWKNESVDKFENLNGYSVKSNTVNNITDISSLTSPFEKYYSNILTANGWVEDISMSAGGPGSEVTAYKKDSNYIILQYTSDFSVKNDNEPEQCPCSISFTIFTGSK